MNRKAEIYLFGRKAGLLEENDRGATSFSYVPDYLAAQDALAISPSMPLRQEPYTSDALLPFFDGLIPEGWLLDIAENTWKLNPRDRFGLLLACCYECIGAVSVREVRDGI